MNNISTARQEPIRSEVQTQTGRAFRLIRYDIIRGKLAPDTRLRLEDLRERYEMGFSPLREALMCLQSEGLVILEQMKGFRVSPVSLDHLYDITRVRIENESLALRWSIKQGDVNWEANVISAFHRLSNQKKVHPDKVYKINEQWNTEHRAFHAALRDASGSPILMTICDTLFDQAERYMAVSISNMDKVRDDVGEHKSLMEAVIERDADKACRLCAEHIELTTEKVVASFEEF